jgi:hypothetical protein
MQPSLPCAREKNARQRALFAVRLREKTHSKEGCLSCACEKKARQRGLFAVRL